MLGGGGFNKSIRNPLQQTEQSRWNSMRISLSQEDFSNARGFYLMIIKLGADLFSPLDVIPQRTWY